ncbi:unnamed protein product, partial [Rotaria sordida]
QIVYQFIKQSFEMICGLLGIICAGHVHCTLNTTDLLERIASVLGQIHICNT